MIVTYVPQRTDRSVRYSISDEVVTATIGGVSDTFDFSELPDGEAAGIISTLDPCPVLSARRVDGELHVTLLRTIGPRPTDPDELEAWKSLWTDVEEVVSGG